MLFKPKYNPKYPKYFERFIWVCAGGIALLSLAGLLGKHSWMLDLLSHFRVQYLQLCLLLAGICLWVRKNKCASVLIAIAAFNYIFILPLYMGKPDTTATEKPLRAMLINLNAANTNTERALHSITNANPDLIILEEVTPDWAFALSKLAEQFPHHLVEPREDPFGIMLLSKYPLSDAAIVEIGFAGLPSITANVLFPQGNVSVVATHPLPPIGAVYSEQRNAQLAALPAVVKEQSNPVLLIGDLNTTQWSPYFKQLVQESGLKDSMKGFGFQPTWPAGNGLSRIPLDHVLHSPVIRIINRAIGADIGSDHLPVIIDFTVE